MKLGEAIAQLRSVLRHDGVIISAFTENYSSGEGIWQGKPATIETTAKQTYDITKAVRRILESVTTAGIE